MLILGVGILLSEVQLFIILLLELPHAANWLYELLFHDLAYKGPKFTYEYNYIFCTILMPTYTQLQQNYSIFLVFSSIYTWNVV